VLVSIELPPNAGAETNAASIASVASSTFADQPPTMPPSGWARSKVVVPGIKTLLASRTSTVTEASATLASRFRVFRTIGKNPSRPTGNVLVSPIQRVLMP
jgi:hypothetical protein